MFKRALASVFCLSLLLLLANCGQTYELQSIEVNPTSPSVIGIGGTQQFIVTAHYSNTKSTDVSHQVTYSIAPPTNGTSQTFTPAAALTISPTGFLEVVSGACTWTATQTTPPGATTPTTTYATSPYVMTVSFQGKTTTSFISVASLAGCQHP